VLILVRVIFGVGRLKGRTTSPEGLKYHCVKPPRTPFEEKYYAQIEERQAFEREEGSRLTGGARDPGGGR